MTAALIGFAVLLLLVFLRMPIAFAMGVVGFVGFAALVDWNWLVAMSMASRRVMDTTMDYGLSVVPLFILMGNLVTRAGLSSELYAASNAFLGHRRGGLAMATIVACGGFSAICGSSLATAATMAKVAMPSMRRYGYSDELATASIASGGTLGILIPPSVILVIYGLLTETSIRELFAAGFIPGLLLTALFMVAIAIQTRFRPALGPPGPVLPLADRFRATGRATAMIGIVVITIGGIYSGFFTAGEAAGVGAFLAFLLALARRSVTPSSLNFTLLETVRTSAFAFLILIGAHIFNPFLALTQIPSDLAELLIGTELPRLGILAILLAVFILLGTFLEGFAILVLTLPIVHPLIVELGYDPIWFGVLMVIVLEMGLISPPVGVNVFVVKGIAEDVPMRDIFIGILPFWGAMLVCMIVLVIFPEIALFLPNRMIQ